MHYMDLHNNIQFSIHSYAPYINTQSGKKQTCITTVRIWNECLYMCVCLYVHEWEGVRRCAQVCIIPTDQNAIVDRH